MHTIYCFYLTDNYQLHNENIGALFRLTQYIIDVFLSLTKFKYAFSKAMPGVQRIYVTTRTYMFKISMSSF